MTSSPRGFYVCILRVYAWGPAKYGGYWSNHSCTRVSPRTCVALRMSACARIVRVYKHTWRHVNRQEHARTSSLSCANKRTFAQLINFYDFSISIMRHLREILHIILQRQDLSMSRILNVFFMD